MHSDRLAIQMRGHGWAPIFTERKSGCLRMRSERCIEIRLSEIAGWPGGPKQPLPQSSDPGARRPCIQTVWRYR